METVYADVYFIVNFSMDVLALFITGKILHLPQRILRICFAGAIGSAYAVLTLAFRGQSSPISLLLSALLPLLMTYVAFGYGRLKGFLKSTAVFWLVSFGMGGIMTALYYFAGSIAKSKGIYINGTTYTIYSDIPLWLFLLVACLCAIFTSVWNRLASRTARLEWVELEIKEGQRQIKTRAMCDSGNLVIEPLGAREVIFIAPRVTKSLFPHLREWGRGDFFQKTEPSRIRIVPYATVGGEGLMYAYLPDAIIINGEEKRACICQAREGMKDFNGYDAIVPISLV